MADIAARQRQLIGSSSLWSSYSTLVLGLGELGIEVVDSTTKKIKIGDGVTTWASLPYFAVDGSGINTATQTALDAKLAKAGGTMTGLVILSGDAVADLGAVTKQQLDALNSTLSTSISGKLSTAGGTLTNYLSLHHDPTSDMHAATKQYVDAVADAAVLKDGDTMGGPLFLSGAPTEALHAATKAYVDSGGYQTGVGGSSGYAGKVPKLNASGLLDSSMLPISGTYLGPIDLTASYGLSGSFGVGSYYFLSVTGDIDGSWSTHLNGSPTTCDAGQFIVYNDNGKWDLIGDNFSSEAIDGKLDKTGGTMTGPIVLSGAPTLSLHAATKAYVDAMVPLAGGTMSGLLILSGSPAVTNGAATKGYVDTADALALKIASNLSDLADAGDALDNLGGTVTGQALFLAANAAAGRTALGLGTAAVLDVATAAHIRANTANKVVTTDGAWSAADPVALTWTSGGTTAIDLSGGLNFTLAASGGNTTLGAPSNAKPGQSGFIEIVNDSTPRTMGYASAWYFDGGVDPTLTAVSGARDVLYYMVLATGRVHGTLRKALA